jgi:ketosteroid isomerase-like protein
MSNAPSQNLVIIRDLYGAFTQGDLETAMTNWAPEISWNVAENHPFAAGNPYIGAETIVSKLLSEMGAKMPDVAIQVSEMLDAGDKIVVLGRYQGPVKATGKSIDAQMAHVWTLKDGKIVHFQQYVDTKQMISVLTIE